MTDLILDDTKDLAIADNDLVVDWSDEQHQKQLLLTPKGQLKQSLDVGVGLGSFLKDDEVGDMLLEIRKQFTKDGMQVNSVQYNNGQLIIDAAYGDSNS